MTIDFDQIDDAFASGIYQTFWRSPAADNELNSHSHFIIIEEEMAFRACRTVSGIESFDLKSQPNFKQYPPCKACQQQELRFKKTSH